MVYVVKWAVLRWIFRRHIAAIQVKLTAEPFAAILAAYPEIPLKPVRTYLISDMKPRLRSAAVVGHYVAASRLLTAEALVESHTTGSRLVTVATAAGEVTVELTGQDDLNREGEWRLQLRLGGRPIIQMGIAIVERRLLQPGGAGEVLWIGAIKSSSVGEQGLDDFRAVTKVMEGMRPKTALLLVAQALAAALGLTGLVAASKAGHVYSSDYSLRRRVKADYDTFWQESGGTRIAPTMFALPLVKAQRDLAEYKPNKRAQARRRHDLELDIARQVGASLKALLKT